VLFQDEGDDVISDFEVGVDRIAFRPLSAVAIGAAQPDFEDLAFLQDGADTVITYRPYYDAEWHTITLLGVDMNELLAHADSTFLFN
jgi:hypothetical protein